MTARGYLELSRLWQEQVDPSEQTALRSLANDIERTALRRRAIDLVLALVAIGMVVLALSVHPGPVPVRLVLAAAIAVVMWTVWKRQQFLKAARALGACEPEAFFPAAIASARAELNYSTFSLWMAGPFGFLIFALLQVSPGESGVDLVVKDLFGEHVRKTMAMIVTLLLVYLFFVPANFRLREQVRRLEAMRREWETEDAGDPTEAT